MEYELGIVVACLPALRALLKYMSEQARQERLRGCGANEGNNQVNGSSPDRETESWLEDGSLMYGGRNKVVIIGGYAQD